MFIDIAETRFSRTKFPRPKELRPGFVARFGAFLRSKPTRLPVADLSDRDLADLNLRRADVAPIDPREVRLF